MTLTEALGHLIDAAGQLPANKQLNQAIKVAEKRLTALRAKKARREFVAAGPLCKCGCGRGAEWFCTGNEFDPSKPDGKGKEYINEPVCGNTAFYLENTSSELNLPFSKRWI